MSNSHFSFSVCIYRLFDQKSGGFVNDKLNIEKLEEKIEKLEQDINKLCNKDKTFTQIEMNCKNVFQKEKLKTIGDLIRMLCHEMNQPLQVISGYSDLIKFDLTENASFHKELEQIRSQISKASSINKKMAAVAKFINL